MRNKLLWILLTVGVGIVFYLSWLPQPRLSAHWFIPNWLGGWVDAGANENLRTAVPFLFLGGFAGLWLVTKNKPFRNWVIAFALLLLVATVAELGQLFLPQRTCDIGDILWGAAGSFAGLSFVELVTFLANLLAKPPKITVAKKMRPQYGI